MSEMGGILGAFQFAALWFGASFLMLIHAVGMTAGWWSNDHITWWVALAALLLMNALSTVDYVSRKTA